MPQVEQQCAGGVEASVLLILPAVLAPAETPELLTRASMTGQLFLLVTIAGLTALQLQLVPSSEHRLSLLVNFPAVSLPL